MVNAKELRVGNWIKLHDTNKQILPMDILYLYGEDNTDFDDMYSPIPLTPELLEKCGFKFAEIGEGENYVKYYSFNKLTICDWGNGKFIMSNAFAHGIRVELKYLHQLQNLYYCLVGEELIVNL